MKFTKMQGAGNDYIYVDGFEERVADPAELARRMSDRHFGVGGDGIILILPSTVADVQMRMFNADGSESGMCGNGIRCVGKYAYEHGMVRAADRYFAGQFVGRSETPSRLGGEITAGKMPAARMTVETKAGVKTLELTVANGRVTEVEVDMGAPRLRPQEVPVLLDGDRIVDREVHIATPPALIDIATGNAPPCFTGRITCVSMGNPHCVIFVPDVDAAPVTTLGPLIEQAPFFPQRTNVEFVQVVSRTAVKQRTWERGSGETLACGTGASAVLVAAALTGQTEREITCELRGGQLRLRWPDRPADAGVRMAGNAIEVFTGDWPEGA